MSTAATSEEMVRGNDEDDAGQQPDASDSSQMSQAALAKWDHKGKTKPGAPQADLKSHEVPGEIPALTNAELVQLRIRVIALGNLMISLLADTLNRQLDRGREMVTYISPRPGYT